MTQRLQLASAWRLILCRAFTALLSMAASLALAAPPLPGQIVRVALQLEPPILDLPGVNYPELSASTILSGAGGR